MIEQVSTIENRVVFISHRNKWCANDYQRHLHKSYLKLWQAYESFVSMDYISVICSEGHMVDWP